MKLFQLIIILLLAGLTVPFEFQNVFQETLFGFEAFIRNVLITLLCIVTIVFLLLNFFNYKRSKQIILFIPPISGLLLLGLIFVHKQIRNQINNSPTLFAADNPYLGNDGGFTLEFKANNHVIGQKMDHWSFTTYWGSYTKQGDTLLLDIPLDFKMGRHGVIHGDTISFIDDTIKFGIYKPFK